MKEYELFISSHEVIQEGKEIMLTIRDVQTMEHIEVKAIVHTAEGLPNTDRLWIRIDDLGDVRQSKKAWSLKILERIEKPVEDISHRTSQGPLSKRKGYMLRSMLEETGRKKITEDILGGKDDNKQP